MNLTSGLILAFAYIAAPGPITVETLRQGMKGGFPGSLAVQSGSLIGLAAYALLALFGTALLLQDAAWQLAAGAVGTALLLFLGITTIRSGPELAVTPESGHSPAGRSGRRAFWTGAALSLANPLDIVFWLSIGSRVLAEAGPGRPAFFGGFFAGCLLASFGIALFAGFWQKRFPPRAGRLVSWACGLALIGFGLRLGLSTGQGWLF